MQAFRPPVIVSLTTIPARNGTLDHVLTSLATQSLAPDEIRIYATPGCARPAALYGAQWIGGVLDLGPVTKLSAAHDLALPPDAIIITCDDDQIYDRAWLETLVGAARRFPECAVGLSGWNVRGFLLGHEGRDHYEWVHREGPADVLEGFAGIAYRKRWLGPDVFDVPERFRFVDDVWISGYLRRRGVARRLVGAKMNIPAPSDRAGLHTRGDFVAMNRAAARELFGQAETKTGSGTGTGTGTGTGMGIKLSICIPSLAGRRPLLARLLERLQAQPRIDEVEILIAIDSGHVPTGTKRNRLIAAARGEYVAFVEDDDLVSEDYVSAILGAIDAHPGVDAIAIRGVRRTPGEADVVFDYGSLATAGTGDVVDQYSASPFGGAARSGEAGPCVWRPIGHICPVRRELTASVPFPDIAIGDDLPWCDQIAPKIQTTARAGVPGQVLYIYEFSPDKGPDRLPTPRSPLTICIPSLHARSKSLARLLTCLFDQSRASELEVLVVIDGGGVRTTGDKRNRLVAQASGAYVAHIDDDDLVSEDYASAIIRATESNADAIYLRGQQRTLPGGQTLLFDFGCDPKQEAAVVDNTLWRQISHLCPVRADIAKATPFPDLTVGEDLRWCKAIAPKIKTSARAGRPGQVLYYYEFSPHKKAKVPVPDVPSPRSPSSSSSGPARRRAERAACAQEIRAADHVAIFTPQYTNSSGPGSALAVTAPYRAFLETFIKEMRVRSILDLGCGDLEIMSHVDLGGASYLGVDVIAERVERNRIKLADRPAYGFVQGDARAYPLSGYDLVICKDVLQHWNNAEVAAWLSRWTFGRARFALVTNCNYGPTVNQDTATGTWRALDLMAPPFSAGQIGGRVVLSWDLPRGGHIDRKDVVLLER